MQRRAAYQERVRNNAALAIQKGWREYLEQKRLEEKLEASDLEEDGADGEEKEVRFEMEEEREC